MESNYLKKLDITDADVLFKLVDTNRQSLGKFSWTSSVQSVEDSVQFIDNVNQKEQHNGAPTRAIQSHGETIGIAAIHPIDWSKREASIGYWIDQSQYGKGIVTRAVGHLIEHAFTDLKLEALTASTEVDNVPSRAVVEKLGFSLEQINETATWRVNDNSKPKVAHYRRKLAANLYT